MKSPNHRREIFSWIDSRVGFSRHLIIKSLNNSADLVVLAASSKVALVVKRWAEVMQRSAMVDPRQVQSNSSEILIRFESKA